MTTFYLLEILFTVVFLEYFCWFKARSVEALERERERMTVEDFPETLCVLGLNYSVEGNCGDTRTMNSLASAKLYS